MISALSSLYLFFLVGVVGMSPALAGLLIFISKIVDMVSDPVMGWVSDRTNTRWGRRRPYMFVASFACALALILLFSVPTNSSNFPIAFYVEFALIFYAIALTAFNVPYLAMPAEMTNDYHERSNLMSYRAVFLVGGGFMGAAVAGALLKTLGGGADAYRTVGYVLAGVTFLAMFISVIGTKSAQFTTYQRPSIPAWNQIKLFFVNKPFLVLGGIKAVQFLQLSAGGAVTLFFFVNILQKDEGLLFPFGVAVTTGSILSLRLWLPIIKKYGKREVFFAALLLQMLVHLSWLLASPAEPLFIFVLRAFAVGAIGGALLICGQSMITDTIEYDRRLSGVNREGMYSSVFSFLEKSMHAVGPLIIGLLLTGLGFDPSIARGEAQPESAQNAIWIGKAWLPALCSAVMALGLLLYNLDEKKLKSAKVHPLGEQT